MGERDEVEEFETVEPGEPSRGTARFNAPVNPDVLRWARESIGYTRSRAAEILKMSETDLGLIEEGVKPISIAKLKVMANKYDRPLIALLLPEVPQEQDQLPDFRMSPEVSGHPWTPSLHKAYRRVLGQRLIMLDLASRGGDPTPDIDLLITFNVDSEDAGSTIRSWLHAGAKPIEIEEPPTLRSWTALIEAKGILVTQVSKVPVEEMRGFSIGEYPFPAIALNGTDTARGRVFTLMHELAHVLMRRSSLCDLDDTAVNASVPEEPIERFCNSVAASTLMPREMLLSDPLMRGASSQTRWSDEHLGYFSNRFGVSEEAVLLRLVTLQKTSWDFYRERKPYYVALYKVPKPKKKGTGGPSPYVMKMRNLGRRYVSTVWNAYERGDISDPEVSRYLQTSFQHVPTLIEKAGLS